MVKYKNKKKPRHTAGAIHFCAEFKKYYKCAPIEYIIKLRMNEALHHLHNINYSITEIAEKVGYEDIYHFSKLFKKQYRVSPMGMRRRFVKK